jgi:hypothetical protein
VLWSREDGIASIRRPVRFEYQPPQAMRIDWPKHGREPVLLDTGAGKPRVVLVHETDRGNFIQHVPAGAVQGREQRTAWLDLPVSFYRAAQAAFGLGAALLVLHLVLRLTGRRRA